MNNYCMHCLSPVTETVGICKSCGRPVRQEVPPHHLLPGTVLNNKFYIGHALGEGGFGITYIGRDIMLDMLVAIKEYYPNGCVYRTNTASQQVHSSASQEHRLQFQKGKERFLQEARILARLNGEIGIVGVRDFFEEQNTAYIVMEYLNGETLKSYIKRVGRMEPRAAVTLLMPVMKTLREVHANGLIHRDISPDNIMLVRDQVKLLDFGAARDVSVKGQKSLSVMLKPGYAPEEQYRSKGEQGPWTDIYALCATLYKCITGITPDDSMQRVYQDELQSVSSLGIAIDPSLDAALMKGLSVMQDDRYQSVDELLAGLSNEKPLACNAEQDDEDGVTVFIDSADLRKRQSAVKKTASVTCLYCGNPMSEGANFCVHCGKGTSVAAEVAAPQNRCRKCGITIPPGTELCRNCTVSRSTTGSSTGSVLISKNSGLLSKSTQPQPTEDKKSVAFRRASLDLNTLNRPRTTTEKCPHCGGKPAAGAAFCNLCGKQLKKT